MFSFYRSNDVIRLETTGLDYKTTQFFHCMFCLAVLGSIFYSASDSMYAFLTDASEELSFHDPTAKRTVKFNPEVNTKIVKKFPKKILTPDFVPEFQIIEDEAIYIY